MIYYMSGLLKVKEPTSIILDVNGIGYEIKIPLSTFEKLPDKDKQCSIYTHLYINMNSDEIRLYGFSSQAEKTLFIRLISISGIGPKIALSVISSMNIGMFIKAVQNEEDGLISKVPGIGKKTAQRIIIELKDDIMKFTDLLDATERTSVDSSFMEVEKALVALGYNSKDIQKALHSLKDDDRNLPVEQQIKLVIKQMYSKS
jgi:Holliday junction DNA helicase RuvA